MTRDTNLPVVMGMHPAPRGFGWVVFEHPTVPRDWGLTCRRPNKMTATVTAQIRSLLEQQRPDIIVMERLRRLPSGQSAWKLHWQETVLEIADQLSTTVMIYTRNDVRRRLGLPRSATRQDIADFVSTHIEALRHRLPRKRRPWDSQDRRMALFVAAALALHHLSLLP